MKADYFSADTQEFLQLLHQYKVKYLIVGGEAVIYYGYPRLTGDVDFFYSPDDENARLLYKALSEFWEGIIPGLEEYEELQSPGYIIQFGVPPNRIDLMNTIDGVSFSEAWKDRNTEHTIINDKKIPVHFIGLAHLIINKRQSGRGKDQEDLNYLESLL